ncbi:MAG: iron-sulfur cluster assembly accessory protein [Pirellulales bacterium]|jgi:iron-sulfur cluster assembly protein|nr:iron-sulfur cluster assembly accessory protein [Thermoguttaceae bacterium]MDD4787115.1 iron-sulfur cluster assembly accessory protein [Pirellulales bacterium]MDI9445547.1 iron-sulfur cluster assembly accessory protein [Planctomycetota bacterium]NLZ02684.1 iron-sulfur cluster assembly accessory protein [Pirellulaceae bacterium]
MAVTLTESAASEVKRLIEGEKLGASTRLRMAIGGGGCSGLQYGLGFDTEFDPAVDAEYAQHGVSLVTKKKFALHLDGTTIDFQDGPMGRGFTIDNPNHPKGGGCPGCGGH